MRSIRIRSLATALVTIAVVGCGGGAGRRTDHDFRYAISTEPSSLSLIGNTDGTSTQLAGLISDGLVGYDANMNYVPLIARSWELAPDGTSVTFHLRDDALWHDGERVTSHDVVYTVKKVREPATQARSWVSAFTSVASIETPDDLTVVVHYAHPYADALESWRVPLIPEHVVTRDADFLKGEFAHHPIGCGPFRFVSHDAGRSVVLEAFDRYWGGRPPLDHVIFRIFPAERTGYETLLLGDLDMMALTPDLWRESLASARAARFGRLVYFRLSGWRIDWNQSDATPFFKDKRVRRALMLALDRERFVRTVFGGLARPGVSSYPPESAWADPSVTAVPFDVAESRRLLDEAGWRSPRDGAPREKDGVPFEFTLLLYSAQEIADRMAVWMQQSLSDVGIRMKIEKMAWEPFQERRKNHRFEAAMGAVLFDPTPDRFDLYHSSAIDGGYNYGGFADAEVDHLLEDGRTTVDPVARRAIYNRLQRRLDDLQPVAFLFQLASPVLFDSDLTGVRPSAVGLLQSVPGPRAWRWSDGRSRP